MPILISVSIVLGIFLGSRYGSYNNSREVFGIGFTKVNKFNDILNYIVDKYVDSVDRNHLIESSLSSMLNDLDPHSSYIPARDFSAMNEPLEGNFEGIGIEFNIVDDTLIVISPIAGGPSEALGILAGDRIIKIEGNQVAGVGIASKDVVNMLRGPMGTKVEVSILRGGTTAIIDYEITRGEIPIYSIDIAYMINDSVGYIKINRFSAKTHEEYLEAFNSLPKSDLTGLILDLRGNPGGYLSASTSLADEFLQKDRLIVYTQGKMQPNVPYYATNAGSYQQGKLVVLIDEGTASASEIVAGAIQDNDRGTIIGRRSFGKGLVQEQFAFRDGSAVRLTVARYYTPTGRCIQRPYNQGLENYYYDVFRRYEVGDSADFDSSYFADSLKFITPGGKKVYGGGGIMPDKLVHDDTSGYSKYLSMVINRGLIVPFAFDYTDHYRKALSSYKDVADFDENFTVTPGILEDFIAFAESKGVLRRNDDIKVSEKIISISLKANIAKNIWNNAGYYPIIQKMDKTLNTAVEYLSQRDTL